ncbi:SPRY domain-containing SOCS box protein 3 [Cylas formicarius]|uniref:SPRY domain-containing SOCS box protein 3 n=1 Tax=Cylas formicarius TaxID=197179 RepID=UPI002958DD8E|nr:SPRY domain-containing SOCS box protein 3 [Cylas formicarius]
MTYAFYNLLETEEKMNAKVNETESIRNGHSLPCDDIWTWDRNYHSREVILSGTHLRKALFHPNWSSGTAAVRGTRVLNNGRYYWELHLTRRIFGTSMMFGIGTKKARLHEDSFVNLLGIDENSWGLSHKGLIWHSGRWTYYTKPFRENVATKIGILFDGIAGTLTYYKDGKCLGVAFRGLNDVKEPLYPIISSTAAKTEIVLDRMKRDFVNLQDRCRAVIVKRIRCKDDLSELQLPIKIQWYLAEDIEEAVEPFRQLDQNINYLTCD